MLREKQGHSPVRSQQQATAIPGLARRRGSIVGAAAAPGGRAGSEGRTRRNHALEPRCSGPLRPPPWVSVAGPVGPGAWEQRFPVFSTSPSKFDSRFSHPRGIATSPRRSHSWALKSHWQPPRLCSRHGQIKPASRVLV